jgi:hypothetical protein
LAIAVGQDEILVLDAVVGRQAALGFAQRHRSAAGMEAHAEIACRADLAVDAVAVLEQIAVVEHGGAARQREFGQADQRAGARGLGVDAGPRAIKRLQPGKEIVVLRARKVAGQGLVEVVVRVDEARQDDLAAEVEHRVGRRRQLRRRTDLPDDAVDRIEAGALQLAALAIHGDEDIGVLGEQGRHAVRISIPDGESSHDLCGRPD